MPSKNTKRSNSPKSKKAAKRKRRKRIILLIEFLILILLLAGLYIYMVLQKIQRNEIKDEEIQVNEFENESIGGFTNIALFGVDSRDNGLDGGNTDAIIVASINNKTKDVKLVSVYRDTYLNIANKETETYFKANSAYNRGGPKQAINMLNINLDLDISDYVTVSFKALVETIDLLGGLEIEITEEERIHMNNYAIETSKITGVKSDPVKEEGVQLLDGLHATSYARIRYTKGDDFKRTERQRLIIGKMLEKAKKTDLLTLNKIIDTVAGQTSTSLSTSEMLDLAKDVASYNISEQTGFPFEQTTEKSKIEKAECVFPINLEENVMQLHTFLFGSEEVYTPSDKLKEISENIVKKTGFGKAENTNNSSKSGTTNKTNKND